MNKEDRSRVKRSWVDVLQMMLLNDLKRIVIMDDDRLANINPHDRTIKFILRDKQQFVDELTITYKLIESVREAIRRKKFAEPPRGPLSAMFSNEELNTISNILAQFFNSLPRAYRFFIEIPGLEGINATTYRISNNVSAIECVTTSKRRDSLTLSDLTKKYVDETTGNWNDSIQGGFFLSVKISGYGSHLEDSQAVLDAQAILKQTLMLLKLNGKIEFGHNPYRLKSHKIKAFLQDMLVPDELTPVDLHDPMRKLLSSIRLSARVTDDVAEYNGKSQEQQGKPPMSLFGGPISPFPLLKLGEKEQLILEAGESNKNCTSIKNALTWAFDSRMNSHDPTMSFIQTAIAIEALLGTSEDGNGKTKLLGERCALLIGTTQMEREKIRKEFGDFYRKRSALIHGSLTKLDSTLHESAWWGQKTLQKVLYRELKFLKFQEDELNE